LPLEITPLLAPFGARITGVDIRAALDDAAFAEILAAFHEFSILVFPDQPMDDGQQIAFSERFGPLESSRGVNPGVGTPFSRQSNLDVATGEVIAAGDRRMHYQKANMLWHSDSTFKSVLSLCSLLSAREAPPEGGATEFASTRFAYAALSNAEKADFEDLVVEHDFIFSRGRTGFTFPPEVAPNFPPVRHALVQTNPVNGLKSLLLGAHAKDVIGWPRDKGRALLEDLGSRATRPGLCYSHQWRTGDAVLWDNQAVLHRATPFDATRHRRLMQRTTVTTGRAA